MLLFQEKKDLEKRYSEAWKTKMKERLNNAKSIDAEKADQRQEETA